MKRIIQLLFLLTLLVTISILLSEHLTSNELQYKEDDYSTATLKSDQVDKQLLTFLEGDIYSYIDKTSDELKEDFGEPERKDLSAYGYTWWVYHVEGEQYVQFGIEDNHIVTVYTTGDHVSMSPLEIGQTVESLKDHFSIKEEVTYNNGSSFYTFRLNEEELQAQPLIKLSDHLFLQCYFDVMTNELSSIRLLTGDTLTKQRFYEMSYRGPLVEELHSSSSEWEAIELGVQLQIHDLTNMIRSRHGVGSLKSNDDVSAVAYKHSKDMALNNYFSHYREDGTGLSDRLAEQNIYYLAAGENIAAQYSDGPAAVHGWLNSEGHREALLNDDYTQLGIGVYRLYYTQNFISKP